jgi:23S rRNA (guanosine2251-2'-O)-methyltransferase
MRIAVILEDIRSIHNVGSIFRTADALGAEKIYCCGITPGPLDRFKNVRADFAKVALGAERSVQWETGLKIKEAIEVLKKDGWQIFAIEQAKHSISYYKALDGEKDNAKIAFILGTETDGILPTTLALADKVLEIPMRGKKESLNVAIAFGIVAFRLRDGVVQS